MQTHMQTVNAKQYNALKTKQTNQCVTLTMKLLLPEPFSKEGDAFSPALKCTKTEQNKTKNMPTISLILTVK